MGTLSKSWNNDDDGGGGSDGDDDDFNINATYPGTAFNCLTQATQMLILMFYPWFALWIRCAFLNYSMFVSLYAYQKHVVRGPFLFEIDLMVCFLPCNSIYVARSATLLLMPQQHSCRIRWKMSQWPVIFDPYEQRLILRSELYWG